MITVNNLHDWASGRNEYNVDIEPRKSIRVYGVYGNRSQGPLNFDKTFAIGDWAEYDSYNLSYTGKIIGIGPKTVTIQPYDDASVPSRRLDLVNFCWRNWDFDLKAIARRNAAWSD